MPMAEYCARPSSSPAAGPLSGKGSLTEAPSPACTHVRYHADMSKVSYADLLAALSQASVTLVPGSRLILPKHPKPFVEPFLQGETDSPLVAEVLVIKAVAAVGKSTLAEALAAARQAPLLDLSTVRVATHSLRGLIAGEIAEPADAISRFLKGELPVIIDGLDEGRLLSEEKSFEDFLKTTWDLLLTDRSRIDQPKLVMIGRVETWDLVAASLAEHEDIRASTLTLDFFGSNAACELVHAHARANVEANAAYLGNVVAAQNVIDAYFDAIAVALGLNKHNLWTNEQGRAFAGYAPVLAALGSLLAKTDNFSSLQATLEKTAISRAWKSIEEVAEGVMQREQDKLRKKLSGKLGYPAPAEAYDKKEQYALLTEYVQSGGFKHTDRVRLTSEEYTEYRNLAQQWFGEHPFLKERELANPVLGAMVLARGVVAGDIRDGTGYNLLKDASRQPFLWRSFRYIIETSGMVVINGRCMGYFLASLATDPTADPATSVAIRGTDDESIAHAELTSSEGQWIFDILPPIRFYGRVDNCDVSTEGLVECHGYEYGQSRTAIFLRNTLMSTQCIDFVADHVVLEGQVWLDAAKVLSSPRLDLEVRSGRFGWRGGFGQVYPWNRQNTSLREPPGSRPEGNQLYDLLEGARIRLPRSGSIVLNDDLSVADPRMQWFESTFGDLFPKFMQLMRRHGLAVAEPFSTGGRPKVRLRLNVPWDQLEAAFLERHHADSAVMKLLTEAEKLLSHPDC